MTDIHFIFQVKGVVINGVRVRRRNSPYREYMFHHIFSFVAARYIKPDTNTKKLTASKVKTLTYLNVQDPGPNVKSHVISGVQNATFYWTTPGGESDTHAMSVLEPSPDKML